MSDIWTSAVERALIASGNGPEAILPAGEGPFDDENEVESPLLGGPTAAYSDQGEFDITDLSPVDYTEGMGEWRELEELPGYTVEDIQRIMQEVYDEHMGGNARESDEIELNPGHAAINDYLESLPSDAVFEEDNNQSRAQYESPSDEDLEDEMDPLPEFVPVSIHTASVGTGSVNGSSGVSDPDTGGLDGQALSDHSSVNGPIGIVSIPELIVTDYDNDQPSASIQAGHSNSVNGHHAVELDCPTDGHSDVDSLPELERMVDNYYHPATHDDQVVHLNSDDDHSDTLVDGTEPLAGLGIMNGNASAIPEAYDGSNYQPDDQLTLSDTFVNDTDSLLDLYSDHVDFDRDPNRPLTFEEAPDDEGYFSLLFAEGELYADQEPVYDLYYGLPRWASEIEVMPGYQAFSDGSGSDHSESGDDLEPSRQSRRGRLGDHGEDEDIPWDAYSTPYSNSDADDETPSAPLSPAPNVFDDLAEAPDNLETLEYTELPENDMSEDEEGAVGISRESRRVVEEGEIEN